MYNMKKIIYFVIPAIMTLAGCKQQPAEPVSAEDNDITSAFEGATDTVMAMELTPVDEMQPAPKPRRSPTLFSPLSCMLRMRLALIKIWSVSDGSRNTLHDVP